MSINPKAENLKAHSMKSSEVLKQIIKQNRDLRKQHQTRILTLNSSPHTKSSTRHHPAPYAHLSSNLSSENSLNTTQSAIKHIQILVNEEITSSRSFSHNLSKRASAQNKKLISFNIRGNYKHTTPEYFKKALYSILKEPFQHQGIKKRQLCKTRPLT